MYAQPSRRAWIAAAAVPIIAALACNIPTGPTAQAPTSAAATEAVSPTSPTAGETQAPPATTVPGEEAAAPPTQPPTGEATPTGDVPTIALESSAPQANTTPWEGMSFYLDLDLFSEWVSEIVPREALGPDNPFALPSHYRFDFSSYPVANDYVEPQMWVFPVGNITDEYPAMQAELARLRTFLNQRPPELAGLGENLPALPPINAAQIIRAQVAYLEFPGGKGLRYVTQHDQAFLPINNRELFYTFQGLTDDGQYYVSVRLPVTHPDLIDRFDPDNIPADFQAAMDANDPESYLQPIADLLNAADPSDFRPDLAQLDAFIQSIRIER